MSVIIRRPWTRQPQTAAPLNRNIVDPRALLWMPHTGDVVGNAQPTYSGLQRTVEAEGNAAAISATSNRIQFGKSFGRDITLFAVLRIGATTTGQVPLSVMTGSAVDGHYLSIETGANLSVVSVNGGTYSVANGRAVAVGERLHIVARAGNELRQIYINGIEYTANTVTRSISTTLAQQMLGAFNNSGTASNTFNGSVFLAGVLPNDIGAEAAKNASKNLFSALFAPQTQRIWIPSAAGTIVYPTLSDLQAINILSTSAQPRITYTF